MSLSIICSTCGDSILVKNAVYVEGIAFCKEHARALSDKKMSTPVLTWEQKMDLAFSEIQNWEKQKR